MILCTLCIAVAVAAAPRAVATPTTLLTEDTFEPSSLYTSRSDLVEVPGSNIAISHDEGSIAIESLADSGGSIFYVVQQMGATGEISSVGLSEPDGDGAFSTIYGTLMLQPDGSLRVAYDAYGADGVVEGATVTKFSVSGGFILLLANCDCESRGSLGCNQNDCVGARKPCDDNGSQTGPWCVKKDPQVFMQTSGD